MSVPLAEFVEEKEEEGAEIAVAVAVAVAAAGHTAAAAALGRYSHPLGTSWTRRTLCASDRGVDQAARVLRMRRRVDDAGGRGRERVERVG